MDSCPQDNQGRTPLHYAAMNGHFDVIKLLIPVTRNLIPEDRMGMTPIKYAAINGHFKLIHLMVGFLPAEDRSKVLNLI